jgi:hypothetical protein
MKHWLQRITTLNILDPDDETQEAPVPAKKMNTI